MRQSQHEAGKIASMTLMEELEVDMAAAFLGTPLASGAVNAPQAAVLAKKAILLLMHRVGIIQASEAVTIERLNQAKDQVGLMEHIVNNLGTKIGRTVATSPYAARDSSTPMKETAVQVPDRRVFTVTAVLLGGRIVDRRLHQKEGELVSQSLPPVDQRADDLYLPAREEGGE